MATISIDKLSTKQLQALELRLQERKHSLRIQRLAKAKSAIDLILKREKLTIDDIYPQGRRKAKRASQPNGTYVPKYRNPQDHNEVWSGRGRRPAWYIEAVKRGVKEKALLIPTQGTRG